MLDVPVPKRLRKPLLAFLKDSRKLWMKAGPLFHPVGIPMPDTTYALGWTDMMISGLMESGVILMIDAPSPSGESCYREFVVDELLEFEARAVIDTDCPKGVKGTLRLAADLMALAADVEAAA